MINAMRSVVSLKFHDHGMTTGQFGNLFNIYNVENIYVETKSVLLYAVEDVI